MSNHSSFWSLNPSHTKEPEIVGPGIATRKNAEENFSRRVAPVTSSRKDISMIRKVMEVIHPSVGGLDVHKEMVMACRRRLIDEGQAELEIESFKTTTTELRRLTGWLQEWKVTHVSMESTGIYWVPVWNVLEGHFKLLLVNAQYLKKVPGRKDDVGDAEWLAQCMQCGLLRASFVPGQEIRQWRHLTRQRAKLSDHHTAVVNRVHAVLHQANIKLASVASDITGLSCRTMIGAMVKGVKDPEVLASLGTGRLKASREDLVESLDGALNKHHRWMLRRLLNQLKGLDKEIAIYSEQIQAQMKAYQPQLDLLDTLPGVGQRAAENILAEIGPNMDQFPTDDDLDEHSANSRGAM